MPERLDENLILRLTKHIDDSMLRSHQSKDKELSGLMADLRKRLDTVVKEIKTLSDDVAGFNSELRRIETKLKNDLEKHEIKESAVLESHSKDIKAHRGIVMAVVGFVFLAVGGAMFKLLGI